MRLALFQYIFMFEPGIETFQRKTDFENDLATFLSSKGLKLNLVETNDATSRVLFISKQNGSFGEALSLGTVAREGKVEDLLKKYRQDLAQSRRQKLALQKEMSSLKKDLLRAVEQMKEND